MAPGGLGDEAAAPPATWPAEDPTTARYPASGFDTASPTIEQTPPPRIPKTCGVIVNAGTARGFFWTRCETTHLFSTCVLSGAALTQVGRHPAPLTASRRVSSGTCPRLRKKPLVIPRLDGYSCRHRAVRWKIAVHSEAPPGLQINCMSFRSTQKPHSGISCNLPLLRSAID